MSRLKAIPAPIEYPFLDTVKEMYWSASEEINKTNESGKLGTRAARNTTKNILASKEFWSMLETLVSKRTKATTDKVRADARVKVCNALTEALTSPMMTDEFGQLAVSVYDAVVQLQSKELEQSLQVVYDIVNEKQIMEFIDMVEQLITRVNLNPAKVTKCFGKFKDALNIGGMANMSDGMNRKIMRMGSTLNGQGKSSAKANANSSARPKLQRSASTSF